MCKMPPLMLFLAAQYTSDAPVGKAASDSNACRLHTEAAVTCQRGDEAEVFSCLYAARSSLHIADECSAPAVKVCASSSSSSSSSRGYWQQLQQHYSAERAHRLLRHRATITPP